MKIKSLKVRIIGRGRKVLKGAGDTYWLEVPLWRPSYRLYLTYLGI